MYGRSSGQPALPSGPRPTTTQLPPKQKSLTTKTWARDAVHQAECLPVPPSQGWQTRSVTILGREQVLINNMHALQVQLGSEFNSYYSYVDGSTRYHLAL